MTTTDETLWAAGFGLGLLLVPQGERVVHVGHDGAMPGFLAGAYGRRGGADNPGALGCAVLASSGTAGEIMELPHELLRLAVELDPAEIRSWAPGEPSPAAYRSILGPWWSEGWGHVFSWHDGALQVRGADAPAGRPPSVFEPLQDQPDVLRTVSGREAGELLRLTRDADGVVVGMHWASYRFTRSQETFDRVEVVARLTVDRPAGVPAIMASLPRVPSGYDGGHPAGASPGAGPRMRAGGVGLTAAL